MREEMGGTLRGRQSYGREPKPGKENSALPLYPRTVVRNQSCSGHPLYIGAYDLYDNRRLELLGQFTRFLSGSQQGDKAAARGHAFADDVLTDFLLIEYVASHTPRQ